MMNRAERRRQMRQKPAAKAPTQMQPDNTDAAIAEKIKQAQKQLEGMKNGKFNSLLNLDTDGFQREMEKYEQARKIIEHNGITEKDLEESYEKGLRDGIHEAGLNITKCCYAAVCFALHDEFGFGAERCYRAVNAVDQRIVWALNHVELTDEVLEKTGLQIKFDEPFERVERVEKGTKKK